MQGCVCQLLCIIRTDLFDIVWNELINTLAQDDLSRQGLSSQSLKEMHCTL